jgi:hypothetical protein
MENKSTDMEKLTSLVFRMLLEQKELQSMNIFIDEILDVLKWNVPEEIKKSIHALRDAKTTESRLDIRRRGHYEDEVYWKSIPRKWMMAVANHFGDDDKTWDTILKRAEFNWNLFYVKFIQSDQFDAKPEDYPRIEKDYEQWVMDKLQDPKNAQDIFGCVWLFCRFVHIGDSPVLVPIEYLSKAVEQVTEENRLKLAQLLNDFRNYQDVFSDLPIIESNHIEQLINILDVNPDDLE